MVDITAHSGAQPMLALLDPTSTVTNFVFYRSINDFLRNEIDVMQWTLLSKAATIIGAVGVVVLTVWIMLQGYRIATGQSRQPMMELVGDSLKATLIVFIATTAGAASSSVYWTLTDGVTTAISSYAGEGSSPFELIDQNLAQMEGAMAVIDTLDTGGEKAIEDAKNRDRWFTGVGIAGPSVIAGSMLLLNKIAIALFVGFGPIFIMCLLFNQTKQLFSKWLLYGIGTVFSLAVLSVMVSIAMKMMKAVTIAFAARYLTGFDQSAPEGINSMALQQGGLGLLLSTLIVMAPPMAAAFFQGTLGQFASYSSFGSVGARGGFAQGQALAQGRIPQGGGAPIGQGGFHGGGQVPTAPPSQNFGMRNDSAFAQDTSKRKDFNGGDPS